MVKIGYDAGHGIHTSGKRTPDGEREWMFNNKIAVAFEKELKNYAGVQLKRFDDATGNKDVPLKTRTDGANNWGADYYISFHHNALAGKWGSHGGVETFYAKGSIVGKALANAVHPALVKAYGLRNRGLKTNSLHITRETRMPAILIEGGFMDSTTDISALRNDKTLAEVGKAVAQAVAEFAGLKRIVAAPVTGVLAESSKKEEMSMKMHEVEGCSKHYVDSIAEVFKAAYENGTLTSDKWYKKAQAYEITLGEVTYINTMLISRIGI